LDENANPYQSPHAGTAHEHVQGKAGVQPLRKPRYVVVSILLFGLVGGLLGAGGGAVNGAMNWVRYASSGQKIGLYRQLLTDAISSVCWSALIGLGVGTLLGGLFAFRRRIRASRRR
jgi:hypothetical protein